MRLRTKAVWSLPMVLCLLLLAAVSAAAQTVTTGNIAGTVTDAQGGVLPGATVTAVHTPTGTSYEAVTGADGRFSILNVRVGPYMVTAHMSSFKDQKQENVDVQLGQERTVDFKLPLASVTETVEVVGQTSIIDSSRAGTADNISAQAVQNLPTISRNIVDIARTSPYFNPTGLNDDPLALSVAGRNNRYNNVQIDGAVYNDVFGLAASGTPGGQTESQPISLDAIQELQLVVSPYDVRQGGFSGGGINAITKSGTNNLRGTGYYFGRNQKWVGEAPNGTKVGTFKDKQIGASLGGPLAENRAFFFGNIDFGRRDNPSGVSVTGSGQQFGRDAEINRFINILKAKYGYDPGGTEEFIRTVNSDKVFARTDFNVANRHQLTVRHNYLNALNDIGRPDLQTYFMPDAFYRIKDQTNSTVAQLNSTLGRAVNELRFTYTRIRDRRAGQPGVKAFPFVSVNLSSGRVRAGTENFSTANELDQDVYELTDDYTMLKGRHTFTFGTHNEFFKFRNLFIRDNFGNYQFNSLDLFEQGLAQSFDYSFSMTSDPRQSARFRVRQYGAYAGDQWRATRNLTVTLGVRMDAPTFPDTPTANPLAETSFGFRTDQVPSSVMWSPRAGFNYALSSTGREQVRGGIGLFSGRTPYVWLSNQYGNTGNEFRRLSIGFNANNRIPFIPDASAQPTSIGSAATNEIDLIDPDYKYPSLARGNLAYDRELGFFGLIGTGEFLYSTNMNDVKYQNLNLVQIGSRPDGRPVYRRGRVPSLSDVILLTNSDQGDSWSVVFKVDRPYRNRIFLNGSYLYGRARSIMDGTSSQAASNWGNVYVPGDPNNPPLTRSNFDPGHRVTMSFGYDVPVGKGFSATASMFYSGQSGRPWSILYNGDYNGDARTTNDLLFIPASASQATFTGGTFSDFTTFINNDKCMSDFIGKIQERNACRSPWINTLDARVNVGLPFKRVKAEITWDVLNVLNLLDRDSGLIKWANFNDLLLVRPTVDSTTGAVTYNIAGLFANGQLQTPDQLFVRDDLRSRWQMQLGGRIRF